MVSGIVRSVGFPVMHKEAGEKRDFLPEFFKLFAESGIHICLEEGYGQKLGFSESDYEAACPGIRFVPAEETYRQQLVVVIRSPEIATIRSMRSGTGLMTMLHYETRPALLQTLKDRGLAAFSLDAIVDDENKRQVVTYEMTAYGGMREAFRALARCGAAASDPGRALKVAVLGMGHLGVQAARYAYRCFHEFSMEEKGWQGIRVEFLEKEITGYPDSVKRVLQETDVLADATRRPDPTRVIIPNDWLASLPGHAVILDLTADPYEVRAGGMQVKAIEGIPHGTLDRFVFDPAEPAQSGYADIPEGVNTSNRRTTISCNAWPGVVPKECMQEYGRKIAPFVQLLLRKGFELNPSSDDATERALYRSTIPYYENLAR